MDVVETVAYIDQLPELHSARLLILLNAFAGAEGDGSIEGLMKLAKLDFLVRYPFMLKRALESKNRSSRDVQLEDYEQQSVESEMFRYRFGPMDLPNQVFLNILCAKGLVTIGIKGRLVVISITELGRECVNRLVSDITFKAYERRSQLLKRHFDLTAPNLMKFIYETFPEIISFRSDARVEI